MFYLDYDGFENADGYGDGEGNDEYDGFAGENPADDDDDDVYRFADDEAADCRAPTIHSVFHSDSDFSRLKEFHHENDSPLLLPRFGEFLSQLPWYAVEDCPQRSRYRTLLLAHL